jgi:hypothetical protein
MKRLIPQLVGFAFLLLLSACPTTQRDYLLFDFESDEELNNFEWQCRTLMFLSSEHVTHGNQSLKLELYPSDYPGITPILEKEDWRNYRSFAVDMYNPLGTDIVLSVRLADHVGYRDDAECFKQNIILRPGANHLQIPLRSLKASVSHRLLDLSSVRNMVLFVESPQEKIVLFTDYWRLEK